MLAAPAPTPDIPAPTIEYGLLSPMLLVFGIAVVGVLVEAFVPRAHRAAVQMPITLLGLAGAFILTIVVATQDITPASGQGWGKLAAMGSIGIDRPTLFIQGTILILALVSTFMIAERRTDEGSFTAQAAATPGSAAEREGLLAGATHTEVYPLVMFAVGGMLLFPASGDLITMFVALEVLSLPLYLLCGLARRRRLLSQEAAVKYFLLGAFSSGFFLFGAALLYGYAGSVQLGAIARAVRLGPGGQYATEVYGASGQFAQVTVGSNALLMLGVALLAVGLLFKLGAVPFQSWKPDVYQGAPTPITALMASCTLVAAFGALFRVFYVAFDGLTWEWRPMMWLIAILTMVVGAVVAVTQTDVKRLLAYSSIAHAGFILTGMIAADAAGLSSALFYLAAYGFTTIGAFAIVTLVRDAGGEAGHLSRWAGLGKRSPVIAGAFAFFLLAFAGIPLTSGFIGKFAVFQAAIAGGATPLVVVGVLSSAVAAFFYVRIIVLMFFSDPAPDGPAVVVPSVFTSAAVALGVAATLVLGVLPQSVLDLADQAASSLFVR
ncbi:MAG: NADH-quinone oxidoreductase subunit NuoN [Streptosporangiales bacterium]|nr:NADH-quinone oxidoreductase subunit NuoN [Streptosporangiales bacterium]